MKILGNYVGEEHTGVFKVLDDTSRTYSNRTDLERALIDCNHALSLDCPLEAKLDLRSLRAKVFLMLDEWDKAEEDAHQALIDIRGIISERHPFEQYAFEMDSSTDVTLTWPLTLAESLENVCKPPSDSVPFLSLEENERKEFGFSSVNTSTAAGEIDDFLILKIKEGVLMLELAEIYRMEAKLGKPTEELLHAAVRLFEKVSKRRQEGATVHDGSNTATARANLGSYYMHTGRLAEAEKYQRDALAQVLNPTLYTLYLTHTIYLHFHTSYRLLYHQFINPHSSLITYAGPHSESDCLVRVIPKLPPHWRHYRGYYIDKQKTVLHRKNTKKLTNVCVVRYESYVPRLGNVVENIKN